MRRTIQNDFLHTTPIQGLRFGVLIVLLFLFGIQLQAQCDRVGWVASANFGCGAQIIDLDNGELLKAIVGAEDLVAGQTIRFGAKTAPTPLGCSANGSKVVILTCVSDTLPCVANFGYVVNVQNAFRLSFLADVFDPTSQFCSWTFGDGSTATGASVQHTFQGEGYYSVCLTVTDASGCSTMKCRNIFVSAQNPNWCGYDVELTAVGTKLFGKLAPVVKEPGVLKSVQWFDNKTNTILAKTSEFTTTLPGEGTYYICAQYEIDNLDGQKNCTTTRCQVLTISSPTCVNPSLVNTEINCPAYFAPVCACNGITYANECEAIAAGVTKWWVGECGQPTSGRCGSDLDFEILSGNTNSGYSVLFHNLSSGNYSNVQLDFGDGSPIWEGSPEDTIIEHFYPSDGAFRTNLSVWESDDCVSSVTKLLVTNTAGTATDKLPTNTDYVFPGDLNGDKKANVYDLLNLGLGFSATGVPRPFATTAWTAQFAPNWADATVADINYKHIDSDGNGVINIFDQNAIEQHYSPIDPSTSVVSNYVPKMWIQFEADTLDVDASAPLPLQISGDIMIGDAANPVFNLYGLAFALQYSEYVYRDPEVYYGENSFFGSPADILMLPKDNPDRRQFDMGLAHKYGEPVSGYGSIAKIKFTTDFIIIIDVIERSGAVTIPFFVPVLGIQAINPAGDRVEIEGIVQDTLWLNLLETNTTKKDVLQRQTLLFPNPTASEAWLAVGKLTLEHVDIFDAYGRLIESHTPTGKHTTRLDTRSWSGGVYFLRIRTAEGIVEKRLLVL